MKDCHYCRPTRRAARYLIVEQTTTGVPGREVYACAKHTPDALHDAKANVEVYPLAADGTLLFPEG